MRSFSFATFNYVDSDVHIGNNTVFYRGIDKLVPNVIRPGVPMFLGPVEIAKDYGNVYMIRTTKPIKLLDFRRLKNLMRLVITSRKNMTSVAMYSKFLECVEMITIAFGLCSYQGQIKLIEKYTNNIKDHVDKEQFDFVSTRIANMKNTNPTHMLNPIEPEGVRIAETQIDRKVMYIIKELFGDLYDGYIAPKMYSPFHVGNASHEEVLIFDPIKSGLSVLVDYNIPIIHEPLPLASYHVIVLEDTHFKRTILQGGGNINDMKNEKRNDMFTDVQKVKEATKLAHFFSSKIRFTVPKSKLDTNHRHPNLAMYNQEEIGCT